MFKTILFILIPIFIYLGLFSFIEEQKDLILLSLIITTIIVKNIIRISNDIGNELIPKTFNNISLNQLKFNNIEVFYNNGSECYYPKNSPCLKHKPNKIKNILYYLQYKIYLGK